MSRYRALRTQISGDSLLRGSVNLVANNLSATALGFIGWIVTTRLFPVADVGSAAAAIALASLVASLALLGAPGTLLRFLPAAEDGARLVSLALTLTLSSAVVLWLGAAALRPLRTAGPATAVSALFVLFVVALVAKAVMESAVIAARASHVALSSTITASAFKIAALSLLGWLAAGAYGVLAAQCVAALVNVLMLVTFLRRNGLLRGRTRFDLGPIRRVGGYAGSQYVNGLAGGLPLLMLPVLVKANLGDTSAGYWYIASLIATAMTLVSAGVGQSLLVEASHDTSELRPLARRAMRGLTAVSVPMAAAALVLSPWILLIFGPDYATKSLDAFRVLAVSTLFSPAIYVLGTVYFIRRRIAPVIFVNLVNAGVVLGLASHADSLLGVAWSWLLGEVVYIALFLLLLPFFPARTTTVGV